MPSCTGMSTRAHPACSAVERNAPMATIVGGIATSHTPTIAFAKDAKKFDDPVWKPIFEGYEPVQEWFRDKRPDVLAYIYTDQLTAFFATSAPFALVLGEGL